MKFRYSRWDGTQRLDDLDAGDVLDALSDDLMNYGDLNAALQRLLRWGAPNMPGLEQLLKQLREARERELGRYNLDSTVEQLRQEVQDVIDTERGGIDRRLDEAGTPEARKLLDRIARQRREHNKMLEDRMEGRTPDFNGFMERYGDMFPQGINSLDELLEHLQRQMAQMQSLLQSLSPEAREELRQMMDALLQDDSLRLELARLSGFMQAM